MIHVGDCLAILPTLEAGSVHTCVTSPPYFGLRDYGHDGQIGLESTPAEFVAKMVDVFREVRRVLRDDGTCWLNLGDSYAGSGRGGNSEAITGRGKDASKVSNAQREHCPEVRGSRLPAGLHESQRQAGVIGRAWVPPPSGFKQKDLMGIPWRVALALQDDGWYLRQDIIWHKPNPMPESVTDRCTKAHEYLFLLAKSQHYYFDADAIAEPLSSSSVSRLSQEGLADQVGSDRVPGKTNGNMKAVASKRLAEGAIRRTGGLISGGTDKSTLGISAEGSRNKRSVWTVTTKPFKGAHFATFPEALIEPCILAGAPIGGVVLDPFMGAGTTAVVAHRLGRAYVGCELNPDYAEMASRRVGGQTAGLPFGAAA